MWAYGAQFRRGDGASPETFATVADVRAINGMDISRNTDDVTTHDSPDGYMEFIGTLKDAGEVSLELHYRPVSHDQFMADLDDAAPRTYKLVVPSSPSVTWTFKAIMTGFSQGFPVDGKATGTFGFKVTGKPAFV
jgi:hypothetical protein